MVFIHEPSDFKHSIFGIVMCAWFGYSYFVATLVVSCVLYSPSVVIPFLHQIIKEVSAEVLAFYKYVTLEFNSRPPAFISSVLSLVLVNKEEQIKEKLEK